MRDPTAPSQASRTGLGTVIVREMRGDKSGPRSVWEVQSTSQNSKGQSRDKALPTARLG